MNHELFESTPIPKAYFTLSLPLVFSMVITLIYNIIDTFFIAQTGNANLVAGIALGAPLFTLLLAVGDIFALGGSSVISRLFGRKQIKDGTRVSVWCFYTAFFFGLFIAVLLLVFQHPILHLLGANAETYSYAESYYHWLAIGSPFIIVSLVPSNLLRTEGRAMASMFGTVLGAVINIILDPIFIFTLNYGAAGAAIATIIGYFISVVFFIFYICKSDSQLSWNPKAFTLHIREIPAIIAIGIPASITNFMQSLSIALTNRFLLVYGASAIAAMGIVMKINMIASLILIAFAFGAQPLLGYNYGAKNIFRLKNCLKFSYIFEIFIGACFTVILSVLAPHLIRFFMNNATIIQLGTPMVRLQVISMIFVGIILVTTTAFQSFGYALGSLFLSISRQGIIFTICIIILSKVFGYYGTISAQAVSDLVTAGIAISLLIHFRKQRK